MNYTLSRIVALPAPILAVMQIPRLARIAGIAFRALLCPHQAENWLYWARFCERHGRPAWAEKLYRRMVQLAPNCPVYHAHLANFYLGQQRLAEAEQCLLSGLQHSQGNDIGELQVALVNLGIAKFDAGHGREAENWWRRAIELNRDHLPTYLHIWIALYSRGHFELGNEYYQRHRKVQASLRQRRPSSFPAGRYLTFMWSYQIGHLALLDGYFKLAKLGWRPDQPVTLLAARHHISNPFLLKQWEPFLKVITDPKEIARLMPDAQTEEDYLPVFDVKDKGCWLNVACALAQREWEIQARPSLLQLDDETIERGRQVLEKLGIPRGAWFVGLHVRDSGYHRNRDDWTHAFRNANLDAYIPAMQAIVRRGGWVVRMGDPLKRSLPKVKGLIDYACSSERTDWMDIFLCAQSKFFLGTQSGLSYVPNVFGVPTVMTNYISLGIPPWYSNDLFIPKLLISQKTRRPLSFAEVLRSKLGFTQNIGDFLRHDIAWIDNTSEEISEVVEEMMDRLDTNEIPRHDILQDQWARLAQAHDVVVNSRMGAGFLNRHQELLDDATNNFSRLAS